MCKPHRIEVIELHKFTVYCIDEIAHIFDGEMLHLSDGLTAQADKLEILV